MSYVLGFEVENKYEEGEIVWGRPKGVDEDPRSVDGGGGPVQFGGTYLYLWVMKKVKKKVKGEEKWKWIKVPPRNIKFPDLKIVWPSIDNPKKMVFIAKYKKFSKKLVIRLKNIKVDNGTTTPTTVNVHVGGN